MTVRASILGDTLDNCDSNIIAGECYSECSHTNYVLNNSTPFFGGEEYLYSLIVGMLKSQEDLSRELCEYSDIGCRRGEILGFKCVQCVNITDTVLCDCENLICNGVTYVSNYCNLAFDGFIDFTSTAELSAYYNAILDALSGFSGGSNWLGIEALARSLYGSQSNMIAFINGIYYLDIGRELTSVEQEAANFIPFPVPSGAKLKLKERI